MITLPAANLYIQGRGQEVLPPRGLIGVAPPARAGVKIGSEISGILLFPTVPAIFLRSRWPLLAGHLLATELPVVFGMVTHSVAELMGLDADYGLRPALVRIW